MPTPLAFIAQRWTPRSRTVRRAAFTALVLSVVIMVTGGVVRLTGSGLGCDTWPKCTDDSLVVTAELGWHGLIEFGNRMLTYVLCAAVGWTIVAARSEKPRRPGVSRLAWAQFWIVSGNAVLGGATVLTGLNPYIVAGHFLLAGTLIAVAVLTWQRTREGDTAPRPLVGVPIRRALLGLTVLTGALLVAGTAVTGTGPHAGDAGEVERMPFDWETVTKLHTGLAWSVLLGTLTIWVLLRIADAPPGPRARARDVCLLLLAQGAVGYAQYVTQLPEPLVGVHLLGSALVWIAVLRLLLSARERGPMPGDGPAATARATAEAEADASGGQGAQPAAAGASSR